jgi:hypothetical protein
MTDGRGEFGDPESLPIAGPGEAVASATPVLCLRSVFRLAITKGTIAPIAANPIAQVGISLATSSSMVRWAAI